MKFFKLSMYCLGLITFSNVCLSAPEPLCSKFSYDEQLLEKMVRMEFNVNNMQKNMLETEKNMLETEKNMRKTQEKMDNTLRMIEDQIKQLEEKEAEFVENISNALAVSGTKDVQKVAFSAYGPAGTNLNPGRTVIFKSVLLNEGSGYSSSTGEFTAPVDGLYLFSVHVCNTHSNYVGYTLVHDGTNIAYSVQYESVGESCSSVNALRSMNVGQKVLVKITWPTVFKEDEYRRPTFMGVLLR